MTTTTIPQPAFDLRAHAPDAVRAMLRLEKTVNESPLDPRIRELVKVRASMLNGCAYCIDMHTKDARAEGESEQRLYGLTAWREMPFFDSRERAALELCDALTLHRGGTEIADARGLAAECFTDEELAGLIFAIGTINAWNRIVPASGMPAGSYEPGQLR
jgi:AhpD family alkylhydroperoxidase